MGVIYYDGKCGLCKRFTEYLIRNGGVTAETLQSPMAARNLPPEVVTSLTTMAYQADGKTYLRSDAAIRAIATAHGWFKIFLWVPRPIRNLVYNWVARNRYVLKVIPKESKGDTPA